MIRNSEEVVNLGHILSLRVHPRDRSSGQRHHRGGVLLLVQGGGDFAGEECGEVDRTELYCRTNRTNQNVRAFVKKCQ